MKQEIFKIDLESLDLIEQEQLFLKAKELLRIVNDREPEFKYDVYYQGSEMLKKAADFINCLIHEPEERD